MRPDLALKRVVNLDLALRSERGGQPSEFMFFNVFPSIREWLPVTNLAALFWPFFDLEKTYDHVPRDVFGGP